jgi:hypothetical protein
VSGEFIFDTVTANLFTIGGRSVAPSFAWSASVTPDLTSAIFQAQLSPVQPGGGTVNSTFILDLEALIKWPSNDPFALLAPNVLAANLDTGLSSFGFYIANADGTGVVDGNPCRYVIKDDQLTMIGAQGQITVRFTIAGDTLTLTGTGGSIAMTRVKQESGPGSIHAELVGKWCWMSQVYANNGGGRQSNRCITLDGNGAYLYEGMTDSYNPNGGGTSQSSDAGTWTATETTFTARSRSGKTTVYQLEKRNHPKNKSDPMIVLNGEPFVTTTNRPPW